MSHSLKSLGEVLRLDNVSRHVVWHEVISWGRGLAALAGNLVGVGWNVLRAGALSADGVEAGEEKGILADEALAARTLASRCHGRSRMDVDRWAMVVRAVCILLIVSVQFHVDLDVIEFDEWLRRVLDHKLHRSINRSKSISM